MVKKIVTITTVTDGLEVIDCTPLAEKRLNMMNKLEERTRREMMRMEA